MALAIELRIPITMNDGLETRPALQDEVRVGIQGEGHSLTHWPDEGDPVAWFEEPGTVVFQQQRGTGWNYGNFYPLRADCDYQIWVAYTYDSSYETYRKLHVSADGTPSWLV